VTRQIRARAEIIEELGELFKPYRYKIVYGGRGGGKSWSIARCLLVIAQRYQRRILCAREYQKSISDSVHRLLADQIEAIGYSRIFDIKKNMIRCTNTGSEFIFTGLHHNVSKIKSMEGVDLVWVEEAETVSKESWDILIPTIRKEGSEIWISFNPRYKTDSTHKKFIQDPPPDSFSIKIGWEHNRWLPKTLEKEKDHAYATDKEAADHVWGGETLELSKAQIFYDKCAIESFEPAEDWHGPYFGVDWGFAKDPAVMVKLWVTGDPRDLERELWIEHEAYGVGVDNDELPTLFDSVPGGREHTSRADNARPETISHMNRHGYVNMVAAEKGQGSVADGIAHLRGYKRIVIHPRCTHAIDEARLYSWKLDKLSGDVLPVPVDRHNHVWDAVRYALEPIIKNKVIYFA